jgi:Na+/H+-dicarboxylate symporter
MISTTRNIVIGIALGIATGLFLGEKADWSSGMME